MARLARLTAAGQTHLITLYGHGAGPVFGDDEDRRVWTNWMAAYATSERVALHAYVLLNNRVRLLARPEQDAGIPRWIQALGRRYGRYYNDRYQRRGTLWDGRYRCTIVDPTVFLLPSMVFMDLEPVSEGLVAWPADHFWSSHRHYLGSASDRFLVPPAAYWALGNTPFAREAAYAELVRAGLTDRVSRVIRDAALKGWVLGEEAFVCNLQQQITRRVMPLSPGRPRKKPLQHP